MATHASDLRKSASKPKRAEKTTETPSAVRARVTHEYIAFLRTLHMDDEPDPAIRAAVLKPLLFAHRQNEADGVPVTLIGGPRHSNQAARRRRAANAVLHKDDDATLRSAATGSNAASQRTSVAQGSLAGESDPFQNSTGARNDIRSRLTLPSFRGASVGSGHASAPFPDPALAPSASGPGGGPPSVSEPSAFAVVTSHVPAPYPPTPQKGLRYQLPPAVAAVRKRDAAERGVQPPAFVLDQGPHNPAASSTSSASSASAQRRRHQLPGPPSMALPGGAAPSTASGPLASRGALPFPRRHDATSLGSVNTLAQHLHRNPATNDATDSATLLRNALGDSSTVQSQASAVPRPGAPVRALGPRWGGGGDSSTVAEGIIDGPAPATTASASTELGATVDDRSSTGASAAVRSAPQSTAGASGAPSAGDGGGAAVAAAESGAQAPDMAAQARGDGVGPRRRTSRSESASTGMSGALPAPTPGAGSQAGSHEAGKGAGGAASGDGAKGSASEANAPAARATNGGGKKCVIM